MLGIVIIILYINIKISRRGLLRRVIPIMLQSRIRLRHSPQAQIVRVGIITMVLLHTLVLISCVYIRMSVQNQFSQHEINRNLNLNPTWQL